MFIYFTPQFFPFSFYSRSKKGKLTRYHLVQNLAVGPSESTQRMRSRQLWAKLREAVLDGTFNAKNPWRMLTSKTFLSRLQQEKYLEEVEGFFRCVQLVQPLAAVAGNPRSRPNVCMRAPAPVRSGVTHGPQAVSVGVACQPCQGPFLQTRVCVLFCLMQLKSLAAPSQR